MAAAAVVAVSCQKEQLAGTGEQDAVTRFDVSVAEISDAGDGTATRASLINTTGDNTHQLSEYLTEFQVAAWEGTSGSTNFIPAYTKVKYKAGGEDGTENYWSTVNGSDKDVEYLWKKSVTTKTFFACANLPTTTDATAVTNASAASQVLRYDVSKVATDDLQTDILMAYYSSTSAPDHGLVPLHFYHPLTSVVFKQSEDFAEDATITGISIEGVYPSGKTTQTSSTGTLFDWTKTDGSAFAKADETLTVSLGSVTVDADTKQIGGALLLIPQTFASDGSARIKVDIDYNGEGLTLYQPLAGAEWEAGFTNNYVINYTDGKLSIEKLDLYENKPL